MSEIVERLLAEAQKLEELVKQRDSKNVTEPLRRLRDAANQVGQAWSGSWLGYQSRVYYADLQATPAGAHFSTEWGFQDLSLGIDVGGTRGEWCEYSFDSVRQAIFSLAGVDSLGSAERLAVRSKEAFDYCQEEFMSIATVSLHNKSDPIPFASENPSRKDENREQIRLRTCFAAQW